MYQKLMILGRLGRDLELNGSGQSARGSFSVATDRSKKNRDGEWEKETQWFNCTVWGKRAESLAPHMLKGTAVFVEGEVREYQKKDGSMGWGVDVKDIQLSGKGGRPDRQKSDGGHQSGSGQKEHNYQGSAGSQGATSAVPQYSPGTDTSLDEIPF